MDLLIGLRALIGKTVFKVFQGLFHVVGAIVDLVTDAAFGRPVVLPQSATTSAVKAKGEQTAKPIDTKVTVKVAEVKPADEKPPEVAKPEKPKAFTSNHEVAPDHPYGIAERVPTAVLMGKENVQLGVMWVYLYPDAGKARRVFKVTNRALASALKRERWYMEDVPYDRVIGVKPIMDQMGRDCAKLLNKPNQTTAREKTVVKPKAATTPRVVAPAPVAVAAPAAVVVQPVPVLKPAPVPDVISPSVVMPNHSRAVKGEIYAGTVTTAGMTNRNGPNGSYQTFCLTIHNGKVETPLFGAELQRQTNDLRIKPGEDVKVVFMGQESYAPGKHRNLYQVSRMERS